MGQAQLNSRYNKPQNGSRPFNSPKLCSGHREAHQPAACLSVSGPLFFLPCIICLSVALWPLLTEDTVPFPAPTYFQGLSLSYLKVRNEIKSMRGMVVRACNTNTWKVEAGRLGVQGQPQFHVECEPSLRSLKPREARSTAQEDQLASEQSAHRWAGVSQPSKDRGGSQKPLRFNPLLLAFSVALSTWGRDSAYFCAYKSHLPLISKLNGFFFSS